MGSGGPSLPPAPKVERYSYQAFDPNKLQQTSPEQAEQIALAGDKSYYGLSDTDYAERNPQLVAANKIAKDEALSQIQGNVPAVVQNQWAKAGLAGAMGTVGGDVTPGSSGEAGVARSIGVNALSYEDRARNYLSQLTKENPQRTFGLTGADTLGVDLGNKAQVNQVNLANNAGVNQANATNAQQANTLHGQTYQANATASAASAGSSSDAIKGIGAIAGLAAMFI